MILITMKGVVSFIYAVLKEWPSDALKLILCPLEKWRPNAFQNRPLSFHMIALE